MLSAYSACLWCELSLERAPENWKCRTFRCLVTCMLSMWLLQYTKSAWNLSQNDILQSLTYPNTHFTGRIFMKFYTEHHNMDAVLYVRFHNNLLTEKVSVNMRNLTRFEWKTYLGRIFSTATPTMYVWRSAQHALGWPWRLNARVSVGPPSVYFGRCA